MDTLTHAPMFDLTKEQMAAYLDWCAEQGKEAGLAQHARACPLARAWLWTHGIPQEGLVHTPPPIAVLTGRARVFGERYSLEQWHRNFIGIVDGLSDYGDNREVSVEQAREALRQA